MAKQTQIETSSPKDTSKTWGYFFETVKHLTTVNTAVILVLTSITKGFLGTGKVVDTSNALLWISFGLFMLSTVACILSMFIISLLPLQQPEKQPKIGLVLSFPVLAFVTFGAGLLCLVISV